MSHENIWCSLPQIHQIKENMNYNLTIIFHVNF